MGWRLLSLATVVITFLGLSVSLATAASATSRPVASASVTVDGSDAQVTVTVNRRPKQIRSATCQVDGTTVDCGAPTLAGRKAATYTVCRT